MYTDEQFEELENEELELTNESIAIILLIIASLKGNLEKELRLFYSKYGKDGVVTYQEARKWISEQDHTRRLTALNLYLSGEFLSALSDIKIELEKMLKSVIDKETGFFDVEVDTDKILAADWGDDKYNWQKRIEDDVALWTLYIANDLKKSLLKGNSIDDVVLLLDKRFKSIQSILTTIGLSESSAIGSMARHKIFKALGISKYRFYTKVDERRCDECGAMHGLVFPISAYEVGVTASPIHRRCRCYEIPIY